MKKKNCERKGKSPTKKHTDLFDETREKKCQSEREREFQSTRRRRRKTGGNYVKENRTYTNRGKSVMTINNDRRINNGSRRRRTVVLVILKKERKLQKHVHSQNIEK